MKLEDFLSLIQDEEARIELEIDNKEDYHYHHFWLSDFRSNLDIAKYYRDYDVNSFSFDTEKDAYADIRIYSELPPPKGRGFLIQRHGLH